ncbi:Os05g0169800 [Oryza sativa Japonica Group]|uniref:Os05g0169800 protein n=1 Tax=Oryza sativa subsp. japonica TaxID=39947 RepID=Q0DKE4_ORYSJ|nr:Os05g0169800 [Oryza sativa Japonica Group]|eukprot:NP_001054765.2 Os05g0169800 [Oryza sativa Japonica Group]
MHMQHAVGYMSGGQFYGAKASLNVWPAKVASPAEFSLSQIWLISGSFGNDLNTIEAGWQVLHFLFFLSSFSETCSVNQA